jgi:hypothetical protein
MAIVTSYDFESDTWTHHNGDTATRAAWRVAVADIATKAKAKLPECIGRVDKAVALVLNNDVMLLDDGTVKVASQSSGTTAYHVVNGHCDCRDYAKPSHNLCKHRLATAIARRAQELVKAKLDAPANGQAEPPASPQASPAVSPSQLPEAPASVNVYLDLAGRQVQLTLRDHDEGRLLQRLEAVLQRFPMVAKPTDLTPQCPTHGPMKPSTRGKGWFCPTKLSDGTWCKGR